MPVTARTPNSANDWHNRALLFRGCPTDTQRLASGRRAATIEGMGRKGSPAKLMRPTADHQPLSAKAHAESLSAAAWETVTWREGSTVDLASRFAAVRLRVVSRDYDLHYPRIEERFLLE